MKNNKYAKFNDEGLLERLHKRDLEAFNIIYNKYWSELLSIALKRLEDLATCEEIVQDVFIELWQSTSKIEIRNLEAYLNTCVKFKVFQVYKKHKKNQSFIEENGSLSVFQEAYENDEFSQKDLISLIEEWIAHLPQKRKEIFKMRYLDGLSVKEISEVTDNSQSTIKSHITVSISKLRKVITQHFLLLILILYTYK